MVLGDRGLQVGPLPLSRALRVRGWLGYAVAAMGLRRKRLPPNAFADLAQDRVVLSVN